jgi:F-type H+-transporting ATPase subunit epsilon
MAHLFQVEVVAADRMLFQGEVESMVIPGADGYFGVLYGHAPLVAALSIGMLTITAPGQKTPTEIALAGGFVEVTPTKVIVLADAAELTSEIDAERARIAKERAEERLRSGGDIDFDRAQAALLRAVNRLKAAGRPTGL